jgi:kumamolisin
MAAQSDGSRASIAGSSPRHSSSVREIGTVDPEDIVRVTIVLRRAPQSPSDADTAPSGNARRGPNGALARSASVDDIRAVSSFVKAAGLTVVSTDAARRTIDVTGPAQSTANAFGVELARYTDGQNTYRSYIGELSIPSHLSGTIVAVLGLQDRKVAQPRLCAVSKGIHPRSDGGPYSPVGLAAAYEFPDGSGERQCVGIVELGGGYLDSDTTLFCQKLGISAPKPTVVLIDGATNDPGVDAIADAEVALDLQVTIGIAPLTKIVVYFAPNTEAGFLNAITSAIHDSANSPSVISISWGAAEGWWTPQVLTAYDQAFEDATILGVNVFCSSGDTGSNDSGPDGNNYVDFPASSPHVTGCGGTQLVTSENKIVSEVAWNDATGATGGGVSAHFTATPSWQEGFVPVSANTGGGSGRGVPDVAGDASGLTGYQCVLDGQWVTMGGTSAVAPLWAGLLARINSNLDRSAGFLNPVLYRNPRAFRDIVSGNNGAYAATNGWDACTGLGTPNGVLIQQALAGGSVAASATLRWTVPTVRTDGTALPAGQVAGADIYDGATPIGNVTGAVAVFVTGALTPGSHTFTVVTRDTDGGKSTPSNGATGVNQLAPPAAITDLTVVIRPASACLETPEKVPPDVIKDLTSDKIEGRDKKVAKHGKPLAGARRLRRQT